MSKQNKPVIPSAPDKGKGFNPTPPTRERSGNEGLNPPPPTNPKK